MYLVPRLIGIGIYAVTLFAVAFMIRYASSEKKIRSTLTVYWITLVMMGYFFVPPSGFDLVRLFDRMRAYAAMPFSKLVSGFGETLNPGERLYYWLIGRFGDKHLLPSISALISMGLCLSILKDQTRKNSSRAEIMLALLLFMVRGPLIMAIDNIRTFMALSIAMWCVYQECINKKSAIKHIPLYVIACSMHTIGYVCVMLRFAFWVVDKENFTNKIIRIAIGLGLFAVAVAVFGDVWQMFWDKAENYYEEGKAGTAYAYVWEGVLSAMVIGVTGYILGRIKHYKRAYLTSGSCAEIEEGYEKLRRFTAWVFVVDICAAFVEYSLFMRLGYVLLVLNIPLVLYMLRLARLNGRQTNEQSWLLLFAMGIFALAATRGYLCSLKFFESIY